MAAAGWRLRASAAGQQPLNLTFDAEGASALAAAMARHAETRGRRDRSAANCAPCICRQPRPRRDVEIGAAEPVEETAGAQGITVAGLECDKLTDTRWRSAWAVGRQAMRGQGPPRGNGTQRARIVSACLMDIELPMVVRFGCTDSPLKALANLGPGPLIDSSRAPEDPVEVLVGGRVVAHGEVVVVSGSYGEIWIVDVVEGRSQALGIEGIR